MTLKEIKYILATAECTSISEAAKKLYVAQPSITHAIQSVELEVGFKIFERGHMGVIITNEGQEFINDIRTVYEQMDAVESKYTMYKPDKKTFSVSMLHLQVATTAFLSFLSDLPDHICYSMKLLETRTEDVIILHFSQEKEKVILKEIKAAGLEFYTIKKLKPYIYLRKSHPLCKKSISVKELCQYPFVAYDQGGYESFNFAEEAKVLFDTEKKIVVSDALAMLDILSSTNAYTINVGFMAEHLYHRDIAMIDASELETIKLGWIKKADILLHPLAKKYLKILNQALE